MRLYSYKNKEQKINYFKTDVQVEIPEIYVQKDMRAFWVSNVVNIDFPVLENEKEYKKLIHQMIDTAVEFNINTIFYQVRPLNDAFYKSKLNPYSRYLSGKEGVKPLFDVLEYTIKEAKKYNIEIHAWCNPYRVSLGLETSKEEYLNTLDDLNFAKKRPDLVITDSKNQLILNPTSEEVKEFIIDSMIEIVENYDVAGIHWDDYFYPYAPLSEHDNDLENFEKREDKSMDLASFRRFHITDVIKRLHQELKKKEDKLCFGVSPFGIWRSKGVDPKGSNSDDSTSMSYDRQYADSYDWVKNEYIDYIVPQLYWEFNHPVAPFADLATWWADLVVGTNVKLYIGHGLYRQGREGDYENPLEIVNQLKFVNNFDSVDGNIFFTYHNFIKEDDPAKEGVKELKKLLGGK